MALIGRNDPFTLRDPIFRDFFQPVSDPESIFPTSVVPFANLPGERALKQFESRLPKMHIDVSETDSAYKIIADLPGYSKSDMEVTIEDGLLRITAERRESRDEETERYHVVERRHGKITRSIRLPKDAMREPRNIEAAYKEGVLNLVVPKMPGSSKATTISIA